MALKPLDKNWGNDKKKISYIGKDFATLKENKVSLKNHFHN